MNKRNLWIASLSGAAISLLVSNLPYLGFVNCLVCGAFWGSAIFAVWLYRRLSGSVSVNQAVRIGALTGLLAGLFGLALSFVGLAGLQGFLNGLGQFLPVEDLENMEEIPGWASLLFNLAGVLLEVGFGALGGWIGGSIFKPKNLLGKEAGSEQSI